MDNDADRPGRHGHTATYIPEINKVVIAGGAIWGVDGGELLLRSVELYDPATGTYEVVGDMPTTRAYHTATYIGEGRVLFAGGFGVIGSEVTALATTLAYDVSRPTNDPFDRDFPPLVNLRALHTAARIDNKVIFVGGCVGCTPQSIAASSTGDPASLINSIEIFDIVEKRTFAPQAQLVTPRALHAMSVVSNNRLLVSGGLNASGPVCNVEIFELQGESLITFDARQGGIAESEFVQCPYGHAQVNIDGARVAFIGGRHNSDGGRVGGPVAQQVSFWNTASGIEPATVNMIAGRYQPNAHTLADGSVIVLGGEVEENSVTAERLYQSGLSYESRVLAGPPPPQALQKAASVLLPNNQVLNFGGYTRTLETRDVGFVYFGN